MSKKDAVKSTKKKTSGKLLTLVLCLVLAVSVFVLTGCEDKEDVAEEPDAPNVSEKMETVPVKLFFGNMEYVNTGTETAEIPIMLPAYDSKVKVQMDDLLDVYEMALEQLEKAPGENYITIVSDRIDFNSVTLKDGTCMVDVGSENLAGGVMEETIFINQVVSTLCGSFDDIKEVKFLKDGKETDSLMGQLDASRPYKIGKDGKAVQ